MAQPPEGQNFPNVGCYLEIIENRRLVWTDALREGFRPVNPTSSCGPFSFTAVIELAAHGVGTKYTATAIHRDEEGCKSHEKMGFHEGWAKALAQLVDVASRCRHREVPYKRMACRRSHSKTSSSH